MRNANHGLFVSMLAASFSCVAALWSQAGIGAGESGSRAGDANMTCGQIAAELQPYMNQMMPSMMAMGKTANEVKVHGETRLAESAPGASAESAAASATMLDPTGLSSKIVGQEQARRQKERWQRAEAEDKPLNDKYKAQTEQVVKEGKQMQSNERLQRLMQLAQEKNCH
jgi:electron transfer flavoprotein alpha subunit